MRRLRKAPSTPPSPQPTRSVASAAERNQGASDRSWWRENLESSLPFLLLGSVLVGLAVWLHLSQPPMLGTRVSLWALLAAVGVTLGGGGVALTLVEEPLAQADGSEDYILVERSAWEGWRDSLGGAPPARASEPTAQGPAPTVSVGGVAAPFDPALVESVGEELLKPVEAEAGTEGPEGPSSVAEPETVADAAAVEGHPTPRPVPDLSGTAIAAVPPPSPAERWREDTLRELETALEEVRRDSGTKAPYPPGQPPSVAVDRCISCGTAVTAYSEQGCVVCDRPLCDRCLEQSVVEGRPAICPYCPRPAAE